jgi:hypothetical protein
MLAIKLNYLNEHVSMHLGQLASRYPRPEPRYEIRVNKANNVPKR